MNGKPLKVLRAIARLNVGGPARQAVLLHDELRGRGFLTVLVHGTTSPGEADFEELVASRDGVLKIPELGARIRPLDDLRALASLVRAVFAERPDVVHTHTAKAGALGRMAAMAYNLTRGQSKRCLVVHTFHGNVFEGYFNTVGNVLVRSAERLLARVTDTIITISPLQRSQVVDRFRVAKRHQVQVVPLGLDLESYFQIGEVEASFKQSLGFPGDAFLVGCVGRLVPIKDVSTMLHALALAGPETPSMRLAVVGDGPERPALERRAAELGLDGRVVFTGWRKDLARVYAGTDAVALSSRNEGTPVALIEAMAAGRPVVATAVGGVPDVVEHEREGLLVPASDPAALASALVRLAQRPDERRRFGAAGRSTAARFDRSSLLDSLDFLYRSGLDWKRGGRRPLRQRANG